jgi:hypothetical protein
MKLFEGKSPEERNKIIAAIVIGTLALLALGNLIFAPFSGKKTVNVKISPTPVASATPNRSGDTVVTALPRQNEIDSVYTSTAVFLQNPPGGGEPGRNIFAFYEPPIPTPFSPTPYVEKKMPTPTPLVVPTPNIVLSYINKQSVYAGEKSFVLEVGGDKFTPETPIWFGGTPLPTKYISPQQLSAEIPANYIAAGAQKAVEVKSGDNKLFSNVIYFNIQQPPQPQFSFLGAVARKRGNNDTAYVQEQGKTTPSSYRLNDIIGGRFRLVSITPSRLLVQDIQLAFLAPYSIDLVKGTGTSSTSTTRQNPNSPTDGGFYNPNNPNVQQPQCAPGIPCNLRPYIPPTPQPQKKDDDVDDNDDNQR